MKRWFRRNKHWLTPLLISLFLINLFTLTGLQEHLGTIAGVLLQFAFLIGMQVVQFLAYFGGLMYFLSGAQMETILPGDIKENMDQYWGQPNLTKLASKWVDILRDPSLMWGMGGRPPKGILMDGPPGGGKTFLARCMAGSAGVPFLYLGCTSLSSMWMGMGALKVMRLYSKARALARRYQACVIVLDEVDTLGSRGRLSGSQMGGFNPMMGGAMGGMVLNRLLIELDGIQHAHKGIARLVRRALRLPLPDADWFVLTIGLTNKPDVIDKALLRSGRLELGIRVLPPDSAGRMEIIRGYMVKVNMRGEPDLEAFNADMIGRTPADVEAVITSKAPLIAAMAGRNHLIPDDLWFGLDLNDMGLIQPISDMSDEDRRVIAWHEAGHAVVSWVLVPEHRITRLTIEQRTGSAGGGASLGHMLAQPSDPRYSYSLEEITHRAAVTAGGRAGETLMTGEPHTGAGGDMEKITGAIARLAYEGHLGYRALMATRENRPIPKGNKVFDEILDMAQKAVSENRGLLVALADALIEHRTLNQAQIQGIIEGIK